MPLIPNPECEKPGCRDPGNKTYQDENGNALRLCESHYYSMVTNGTAIL